MDRLKATWLYEPGGDGPLVAVDAGGLRILLTLLADANPIVRRWAAQRLEWSGHEGRSALPEP